MSSKNFIIIEKTNFINREEWHNHNLENLIRLYNLVENILISRLHKYKYNMSNEKFNMFSRLIHSNSSQNIK
tara:strand:+ start:191 stop:406 length:216 start_codon:yes stop_codon:yes gene_type:complete